MSDEVRIVDPLTGGEKGSKPARYDLIPAGPLRRLAEHFGYGATKYADRNWERGYRWSLSFAALNRHLWAFWNGENIDAESGSDHITAVIWHAMALSEFAGRRLGTDDRPYQPVEGARIGTTERRYDPLFVGRPGQQTPEAVSHSAVGVSAAPGASYAVCICAPGTWDSMCPHPRHQRSR